MLMLLIIGFFAGFALYGVPQKKLMRLYTVIAFAISCVGYRFKPNGRNDLVNHFSVVKAYMRLTWAQALEREHYKAYPVAKAYYYAIAKIFHNEHFLPAVTIFIVAMLFSITLRKCAKQFDLPKRYEVTAYVYFLCTFNFFYLASNIRNLLAVGIFAFFLYMDMVEKKNRILCYAVYLSTIFIHSSMAVFIILRLVLFIKNKRLLYFSLAITMLYTLFQDKIFEILQRHFSYDFIDALEEKATLYSGKEYRAVLESVRGIITLLSQFIIIWTCWNSMQNNEKIRQYFHYVFAFVIFTAISYGNYWLFMRMSKSSILFFPIILAVGCGDFVKASVEKQTIVYSTFLVNVVYLFLFQYSHM